MEIFLLILCVLVILLRNMGLGLIFVGLVWLFAAAFNPPITSPYVWFIAFTVGILIPGPQID